MKKGSSAVPAAKLPECHAQRTLYRSARQLQCSDRRVETRRIGLVLVAAAVGHAAAIATAIQQPAAGAVAAAVTAAVAATVTQTGAARAAIVANRLAALGLTGGAFTLRLAADRLAAGGHAAAIVAAEQAETGLRIALEGSRDQRNGDHDNQHSQHQIPIHHNILHLKTAFRLNIHFVPPSIVALPPAVTVSRGRRGYVNRWRGPPPPARIVVRT